MLSGKFSPFSLSRTAFSSSRAEKRFESGSSFILCLYPHFSQFSWVVWGGGCSAISKTVPTVALDADAGAYSWGWVEHHQTSLSVVHFTFSVSNEHRNSQDVICRLQLQSAVEGTQTVPSLHSSQFFSHTFLWWQCELAIFMCEGNFLPQAVLKLLFVSILRVK